MNPFAMCSIGDVNAFIDPYVPFSGLRERRTGYMSPGLLPKLGTLQANADVLTALTKAHLIRVWTPQYEHLYNMAPEWIPVQLDSESKTNTFTCPPPMRLWPVI